MVDDKQLQKDVLAELAWEPRVDAAHIGVTAEEGVISLTGHVGTYAEKLAAEEAAGRVKGVRAVATQVQVKLTFPAPPTDETIAETALQHLRWHAGIPADLIRLKVEHGYVTLYGEVKWQYQGAAAESDIRKIKGVIGVNNQIVVTPMARPLDVRQKIEQALKRNAEIEASGISVSASDGTVTLTGRVATWPEREVAERAAWSAPGVTRVVDDIRVGAL